MAELADTPDLGKRNQLFQNAAFQFEKQSIYVWKTHLFTSKTVFTNGEQKSTHSSTKFVGQTESQLVRAQVKTP